jgi:hypothetical protein
VEIKEGTAASAIKTDTVWKKMGHNIPHNMCSTTNRGDFLEIATALGDDTAVTAGGGSPFGTVGEKVHGETRTSDGG